MDTERDVGLTSVEISDLWTAYQADTMVICGIKYYLTHIKNEAIRDVLEYALKLSEEHVQKLTDLFKKEQYPIPQGFTEQDVNLNAPRLFTDKLYLLYILNMAKYGLATYSLALSYSERSDVMQYFTSCLNETEKLHNWAKEVAKEKGILVHAPHIPKPEQIDFVNDHRFLSGYIGEQRPLLGVEIGSLVYNAKRNALGQAVITGFSQVAQDKKVRKYFEQGRDISGKHLKIFSSLLNQDYLSEGTTNLTSEVTDSTIAPFSDKLMMFHVAALIASGIGQYGLSISTSPRHDLGVKYSRLMAEIAKYSNEGAKLMIDNSWMEYPPEAPDRKNLAKDRK